MLVGLMMNTNYMVEDLGGNSKRAAILSEFTDYVFRAQRAKLGEQPVVPVD